MNPFEALFAITGSLIFFALAFRWLSRNLSHRRASGSNLDGKTRVIHRICLRGFTIAKWRHTHRTCAADWAPGKPFSFTYSILVLCALCAFTGCAYNASYTTEKGADYTRNTKARGFTLFDGQAQLAGFKNQVGGTNGSGTTVGSLAAQSSTTTNFNDLAASIVGAAVKAAKTP